MPRLDSPIRTQVLGLLLMLGGGTLLPSQTIKFDNEPPATASDLAAVANIGSMEVKLSLDHGQYLPGETAQLTVIIRNPTSSSKVIPKPFDQRTGGCFLLALAQGDRETARPSGDANYTLYPRPQLPLITLGPGQELSRTITTLDRELGWTGQFRIPLSTGRYRLKYGYDGRAHADFSVVGPRKLWSATLVHLPPNEVIDRRTGASVNASSSVVFMAVEADSGDIWLFRTDPTCCREYPVEPNSELTLHTILAIAPGFRRLERLDEPVLSMRAVLHADEMVDLIAEMPSRPRYEFHFPVRPQSVPPPRNN